MMHGFGYMTSSNGRSYEGFFVDDVKQGYGILKWGKHNSNVYRGTWIKDR